MPRRRGGNQRFRGGGTPFVALYGWMTKSPAWRDLGSVARDLYRELKSHYNGSNNGSIGLGVRQAAEALDLSIATISRAFARLEDHGFIEPTAKSIPGTGSGYRKATEFRLTECYDDRNGQAATKDFLSWPDVSVMKRKNSSTVSKSERKVTPVKRSLSAPSEKSDQRSTSETSDGVLPDSAFHAGNTLTSSHRQIVGIGGVGPQDPDTMTDSPRSRRGGAS